jgi:hypothetical protein
MKKIATIAMGNITGKSRPYINVTNMIKRTFA